MITIDDEIPNYEDRFNPEKKKIAMITQNTKCVSDLVTEFLKIHAESRNIDDKESFAIFIHQPFCSTSYEFNKILTMFAEENKISFYKISFDEMKKTVMYENIKYYPSFAIYNNGKLIDFLEADSNEDLNRYKVMEEFKNWFNSYIQMKDITE